MNTHSLHICQATVNDFFYKTGIILYGCFMKKILISACLAGELVRYDGRKVNFGRGYVSELLFSGKLVVVCPEVLGTLAVPRPAAQIVGGNGMDVLNGNAKVIDSQQNDLTGAFVQGAYNTLAYARRYHIFHAVFKEKSPSCGVNRIYDGTFSKKMIPGTGVTVALLKQHGIRVISDEALMQPDSWMFNLFLR